MGQPIVVIEKPSVANPGMVRFETNRSITGMGHEVYPGGEEIRGDRPPDELARRLMAHAGVSSIHMNGSVVTVDLAKGMSSAGLKEVIEGLYIHYPADAADATAEATEAAPGAPETEGEVVEAEAAAPATDAPAPSHEEPVASADVEATDGASGGPGPEEAAEAPAAGSSSAVAEPGEETEADVAAAEGDAPTLDQASVGGSPSDPPADDPTAAPTPDTSSEDA